MHLQAFLVRSVPLGTNNASAKTSPSFTSQVDEVLGLHPVPEIDSAALKRQPGLESLAMSFRWEKRTGSIKEGEGRRGPACSTYLCIGRISVAYPAGLASAMLVFLQGEDPRGGLHSGIEQTAARPWQTYGQLWAKGLTCPTFFPCLIKIPQRWTQMRTTSACVKNAYVARV